MDDGHSVVDHSSLSFDDPDRYHAAIRGGDSLLSFLERGIFRAQLTTLEVGQVTLQRGREILPRLSSSGMPPNKVGVLGWFGGGELPIVRGIQMRRGDWVCLGPGMQSHHRSSGPVDFVTLTLDASDLTRTAFELTGRAVTVEAGKVLRPPAHSQRCVVVGGRDRHRRGPSNARLSDIATGRGCARACVVAADGHVPAACRGRQK